MICNKDGPRVELVTSKCYAIDEWFETKMEDSYLAFTHSALVITGRLLCGKSFVKVFIVLSFDQLLSSQYTEPKCTDNNCYKKYNMGLISC